MARKNRVNLRKSARGHRRAYSMSKIFNGKTFVFNSAHRTKSSAKKAIKAHNLKVNRGKARIIKGKNLQNNRVYYVYHRGGWHGD